jgi:hypothetical protein
MVPGRVSGTAGHRERTVSKFVGLWRDMNLEFFVATDSVSKSKESNEIIAGKRSDETNLPHTITYRYIPTTMKQ